MGIVTGSSLVKKISNSPFDHAKDAMNKWDGGNLENMKASYGGIDNRTNANNKDKSQQSQMRASGKMVQSLAMPGEAGATAATLAAGKHKNLREVIEGSNNQKVTNSEITVFNDENQQAESQSMKINSNTGCKPMQVDLSQRAVSTENDMNMGLKKDSGKKMVFYRLK